MSLENVKRWFDCLQETLQREAELAGILDHGSMVGTAREFFVKRMLTTILPPAVHVGTGKVIGGGATDESKQVDVIIYDSRCPFLESQPGMGLYFVEGVIATIEIKSTLNTENLETALDNCLSVMRIPIHLSTSSDLERRAAEWERLGMSPTDAIQTVHREATPRTYIFAFKSGLSAEAICKNVSGWYDRHEHFVHPQNPFLPSVIAAEGTVGLQREWWLSPESHLPNTIMNKILQDHGSDARIVIPFFECPHYFGWLAIHLIQTVHEHLGLGREFGSVRRAISGYLPGREYFLEMNRTHFHSVVWSGSAQTPSHFSAPLEPMHNK